MLDFRQKRLKWMISNKEVSTKFTDLFFSFWDWFNLEWNFKNEKIQQGFWEKNCKTAQKD